MSKITRDDIQTVITETQPYVTEVFITEIINLTDQREAEFAELVEAAVAYTESYGIADLRNVYSNLKKAAKPFLPPTSPADRLDALALSPEDLNTTEAIMKIRAIAAELREKHDAN